MMTVDSRRWRSMLARFASSVTDSSTGRRLAQAHWATWNQIAWYQATPALSVARVTWPRWIKQLR